MINQQSNGISAMLQQQVSAVQRIKNTTDIHWDGETDVAVVGYGLAGASAALEASEQGAHVTMLDRLNGGGASALSGGIIYAGGGTKYQQQAGEQDSVENMINYLRKETAGVVSEGTLRNFCQQSIPNLEWLEKHGVAFDSTAYETKTSYPPEDYFLYYSGNETAYPYSDEAIPAKRGHRAKGQGFTGKDILKALVESAQRQKNIQIRNHCDVTGLIVDQQNQVVGIKYLEAPSNKWVQGLMTLINKLANRFAVIEPKLGTFIRYLSHLLRHCGKVRQLKVNKGLILSAGGFIYNRDFLQKLAPAYKPARSLGEDCIGRGISLGVSAGGQVNHMKNVSAWRFIAPPNSMLKGIIVNEKGARISNEDLYGATLSERVLLNEGERSYLIIDKKIMDESKYLARPGKMSWVQWLPARLFLNASANAGKTIKQLAEKCNIESSQLQRTIENYNTDSIKGQDRYKKSAKFLQPIEQGPFYALDVSMKNWRVPFFAITLGGLCVNENTGAVLDARDNSIKGLYAAGRNAVGICSNSYVSGLSLADCVFSGRRAGNNAALVASK